MKNVNVVGRLIPNSGKIHQNQEVYLAVKDDLMARLKATSYKDPPKILIEVNADEQNYANWKLN